MRRPSKLFAALSAVLFAAATAALPAQDWAKAQLDKSPRHREYVPLKHDGRTVNTFVVYPEVSHKAPVIVMIHEIFGLSDWAREMADELAAQGYIVVLPDLLSGAGPNGGGTEAFPGQDAVTRAVSGLNPEQVMADLDAAADYGKKLPAANGRLYVAGFCWGGGKSFAFAVHRHDLTDAFVFYGPPPPDDALKSITAPVYGFYAGNDMRISATVPATTAAMKAAGKQYETVIYDGAGHGFMRAGEAPDASDANKKAREAGFAKMIAVINGSSAALHAPSRGAGVVAKAAAAKVEATGSAAKSSVASAAMDCHDMSAGARTADTTKSSAGARKDVEMAAIMKM